MVLPPTIERELRLALRKQRPVKTRLLVASIGTGVALLLLFLSMVTGTNLWSGAMHSYIFALLLYVAIARPVGVAVGLFSEERRNQTLELLFLAGLNSFELFIGKLLGGILVASCDLLALFPLLALPFLAGGVSLDLYLAIITCLPVLLLFCVTVAVLASVACEDDASALVWALAIMAFLSLATPLPYAMGKALTGTAPFSSAWLSLSPAYAAYLVFTDFSTVGPSGYWKTILIALAWTCVCLVSAAWILQSNWRNDPDPRARLNWRRSWREFVRGTDQWHRALRRRLLEQNPFQWLAQRDRAAVIRVWTVIATIGALWLLGWWAWPREWPCTTNFLVTILVLMLLFDSLARRAAARRIAEERRDGTLELLLTTPLTPEEIVEGQVKAAEHQFLPARRFLLTLCIVLMVAGFFTRDWNVKAVISYLLVWVFFLSLFLDDRHKSIHSAMWIGLNAGRPGLGPSRWLAGGWGWIWILFNLQNMIRTLGKGTVRFPTGSTVELVVIIFGFVIYFIIKAAQSETPSDVRALLLSDLRSIAQEPVPEPSDPRFKKWDTRGRLPAAEPEKK